MKRSESPIVLEYTLATTVDKLWSALVEIEEMVEWYFDNIPDFKPEVGFQTAFLVTNEGRRFTHLWEVTQVVTEKEISYSWRYEEYPGESIITFSLRPAQDQVKLRLVIDITEDFPQDIPEFKRESCVGGWNYFIGERLATYLANKQ